MSFFNYFYNHPLVVGCTLIFSGFGVGFSVNQFFSDHLHKVETVQTDRLSEDVSTLQQQVLSKDELIQNLSSELANTRNDLIQQRNEAGSENVSFQSLNQKHSDVVQDYNQLLSMYKGLQSNYQKVQQNCDVLSRIGFLEQKRRNLENQLTSASHDVFENDLAGKKNELQILLAQNHEQLLNLQRQLSR